MSLLTELESRGVTAEDLEKAASVRLFEKAAAAEGVDLDTLDVNQVEDLYAAFLSDQSDDDYTKEASAMNDEIVDLFEKTAAAEGIDLDEMADHELAELYNHYVENVLPEQVDEYEKEASAYEIDDATEKLAEAEILGRHMARAYMDEMDKEAQPKQIEQKGRMGARLKELATGHQAASQRAAKRIQSEAGVTKGQRERLAAELEALKVDQKQGRRRGPRTGFATGKARESRMALSADSAAVAQRLRKQKSILRAERMKGYGKRGLAVGAAGGLAYGAKKMMDKRSSADEIYEIAYDRAEEFAKVGSVEDYDGSFIDDMACDILDDNGYYLVD